MTSQEWERDKEEVKVKRVRKCPLWVKREKRNYATKIQEPERRNKKRERE